MKKTKALIVFCLLCMLAYSQVDSLKSKALEEFRNENYPEAIRILKEALITDDQDAEIYYYLGFFNHYLANDSRPMEGYDLSHSEEIFDYLHKAIELNPDYGDAKYFYGAECSANAFKAMQSHDCEKLKYYYKKAFEIGAYPPWLLELGRNILKSCDKDGILFTGGNADFDVCMYLQLHEKYRNDITIIPIGNIDRPYLVKYYKDGLEDCTRSIDINLTYDQIMEMHPYKWKETEVAIPVPEEMANKYGMKDKFMIWNVKPDFSSVRMASKIEGEEANIREYLSPQRAVLLNIIESNQWRRPVHFSMFCDPYFMGGLDEYVQDYALVWKLLPVKTEGSDHESDYEWTSTILLDAENVFHYPSITETNIPRISGVMNIYWALIYSLASHYYSSGNVSELNGLIHFTEERLCVGFQPERENMYLTAIKQFQGK